MGDCKACPQKQFIYGSNKHNLTLTDEVMLAPTAMEYNISDNVDKLQLPVPLTINRPKTEKRVMNKKHETQCAACKQYTFQGKHWHKN